MTHDGLQALEQVGEELCHRYHSSGRGDDINYKKDLDRTRSNVSVAETLSPWHEALFVAVLCSTQLATQYGLGQCLSILHIIGDDLDITHPGELSWLIAGYSLTVGTFILVSGRFGDLFGHKRVLIFGFFWFALWSMVTGLAVYSGKVLFIFARCFQGTGAAVLLPNALGLLGRTYAPGPKKNMVFAIFGATAPVGSVLGSCFGGVFAPAWWPWVFWSFAIALIMIGILGLIVVPNVSVNRDMATSWNQTYHALDPIGSLVGVTSLILINFALNQAPVSGWASACVIVTLVIGVLLVPVFFLVEIKIARHPLLPFKALNGDVAWVLACVSCGWACFGIWIYYIWQFMEVMRGTSPLLSVAWLCPVAISGIIAAITTGRVLPMLGPSGTMIIAMLSFLVGTILLATAPVDQIYWGQLFVCTLVIAWGMDMSFPSATVILSNSVSRSQQGIGASLVNTVVNYSISLGLGFAATVEIHVNNGGETLHDTLRGYRGALYMGIGLAGLGVLISSLFALKTLRNHI